MNGYAIGSQNGWMSANDIRELENLDLIPAEEGGDLYLINGNMTKLKDAGIFAGKEDKQNVEEISNPSHNQTICEPREQYKGCSFFYYHRSKSSCVANTAYEYSSFLLSAYISLIKPIDSSSKSAIDNPNCTHLSRNKNRTHELYDERTLGRDSYSTNVILPPYFRIVKRFKNRSSLHPPKLTTN